MAQDIYRPGEQLPTYQRATEVKMLEDSIDTLRTKINLFSRLGAHFKAGKNAANVLVAMQKDVADAQRDVVQTHANLIARARKMELTDRFQAGLSDLTRRVAERTDVETRHYWEQLSKRLDHYEEFFESRIRDLRAKATRGEMTEERAAVRISQYESDRDGQQAQDRTLLHELIEANVRIVRRALTDYQPN
jgi:hypothetical protein